MRKILLAAAGAMALVGGATAANAAASITAVTSPLTAPASSLFGDTFNNMPTATTAINDTFTFNLMGGSALADSQVSTILLNGLANITFSSITLDGNAFTKTSTDPGPETWALLSPILLANGTHTINVMGTLTGANGAYSGTLNVSNAVPEPATWAMMLLGFGGMGFVMRRRRNPVLAQIA